MKPSTIGRAVAAVGLVLVMLLAGMTGRVDPASAGSLDDEELFVALINRYRAGEGVGPLTVDGELTIASRGWAQSMADADNLVHAPNISAGLTAPWIALGENVGVHGIKDVQQLFDAFIASPAHRANIVDPKYSHVGVGVVYAGDKLWTTHRFMALETATTSPPTTTVTPSTTAPPPATTVPTAAPASSDAVPSAEIPDSLAFVDPAGTDLIADVIRDLLAIAPG